MITLSDEELIKLGEDIIGPLSVGEFGLMKLVQDKLVELNVGEKQDDNRPTVK